MRKRLVSVCFIGILLCGIYKYAPIAEAPIAKPVIALDYTEERVRIFAQTETEDEILSSPDSVQPEPAQRQWQVYIQPDMPEPFIEVLKQYEEFTNADVQDINDENVRAKFGKEWCYLYDEVCAYDGNRIRYSLTDLTGDGFPELIMGIYVDYTGIYDDYFDKVYPKVVYYISPTEGIKMEFTTSYFSMDFYEGGIIEHISAGVNYTITYRRFQEETESWELADRIIVAWDSQDDSESYYWGVNTADFSNPANEPMSDEEYREIVERYTAEPVELEWVPLFGGEASEDEAKLKTNEPVTVIAKVTHYYTDESLNSESEYEYDGSGNLTRRTDYDANGSFDGWIEWEYDSSGNLTRQTRYDADGNTDHWYEYGYDSAGNQVKWISYDADGNINYWYEYGYDSEGNQVKEISYNTQGNVNFWYGYGYDSAGNQVKRISYNAKGKTDYWYEYEYDSDGNNTKSYYYDHDGSIKYRYENEYDSSGNRIRRAQYNADGSNYGTRTEWEYDTEGKLMRCISYDVDGSVVDCYEYKYDSTGNLTEEINCGNNSSTYFRTEYEYDSEGNLKKMTEYYLSHRIESEYITITPQ